MSLIEGDGDAIRQTQSQSLSRSRGPSVCGQARAHILHKSAQLCKLLRDPGRSDERAFAAANLNETPAHTILNCPANGNAASLKSFNESVFERLEILRGRPRPLQGGHQTAFC